MRCLDLHSHILPGVDDGAQSVEESIQLLTAMKEQGITDVLATPHFDATRQSLPDFSARVRAAYATLEEATKGLDLPHVFVGSEVFYFTGIGKSNGIRALSLAGSHYFLLELPGCKLDKQIMDDIVGMRENLGLTPILAHVERYDGQRGYKNLLQLVAAGVARAQINASSLTDSYFKKPAWKLLKKNLVTFIATDSHSPETRPPKMQEALQAITTELGEKQRDIFIANSDYICQSLKDKFYEE